MSSENGALLLVLPRDDAGREIDLAGTQNQLHLRSLQGTPAAQRSPRGLHPGLFRLSTGGRDDLFSWTSLDERAERQYLSTK